MEIFKDIWRENIHDLSDVIERKPCECHSKVSVQQETQVMWGQSSQGKPENYLCGAVLGLWDLGFGFSPVGSATGVD